MYNQSKGYKRKEGEICINIKHDNKNLNEITIMITRSF
jgi:hypothetical protein